MTRSRLRPLGLGSWHAQTVHPARPPRTRPLRVTVSSALQDVLCRRKPFAPPDPAGLCPERRSRSCRRGHVPDAVRRRVLRRRRPRASPRVGRWQGASLPGGGSTQASLPSRVRPQAAEASHPLSVPRSGGGDVTTQSGPVLTWRQGAIVPLGHGLWRLFPRGISAPSPGPPGPHGTKPLPSSAGTTEEKPDEAGTSHGPPRGPSPWPLPWGLCRARWPECPRSSEG